MNRGTAFAAIVACLALPLAAQLPTPAEPTRHDSPPTAPNPVLPFREIGLSGKSTPAAGVFLELGKGRYEMASGRVWELVDGEGQWIGVFLDGPGRLTWKTGDAVAARVYARNARRVGGVEVGKDDALLASFEKGTLLFSEALRPGWRFVPTPEPAPKETFRTHRERFAGDRMPPADAGLAAAERSRGRFFEAFLESRMDVCQILDDVRGDRETLWVVDRPAGLPLNIAGGRISRVIASEPLGRSRRAAPRVDLRLLRLETDVRETQDGWGVIRVDETLRAERPVSVATFRLASYRRTSRTHRIQPTKLTFVRDVNGRTLPFSFSQDSLSIFLPGPVPPGETVKLNFEYEAYFFERVAGDQYWELGLGDGWYPIPSEENASAHTFRATVRAKKPLQPFTAGETVRRAEDGEWNLVESRLERPVPFVAVVAGAYTLQEATQDGVTCRVASYGLSKETSGAKLLNLFHGIRKFYEALLGPFPWKEFTILEINTYGFGQAPPGMMFITQEAFQSNVRLDFDAALFSSGVNERLAHEIAHSYFGYVVTGASQADEWIDEAFSEILAAVALEVLKSKDEGRLLPNVWRRHAKDATKAAPVAFGNELAGRIATGFDEDNWRERVSLVYFKGATLLNSLRMELGDDIFFTVLRSFLRSFEKRIFVTTDDFIGLLNYVTKKDWKPWFEKYYYGFEMP